MSDPDIDGDGVLDDGEGNGVSGDTPCTGGVTVDCDDNCPLVANSDQFDIDGNTIGDACDDDQDGDTIPDDGDGSGTEGDNPCAAGQTVSCDDNCMNVPNLDQADLDGDGVGEACDTDLDGDDDPNDSD